MRDPFARVQSALERFDGAAALAACDELGADGGARGAAGRVRALWLLRRWDEGRTELAKLETLRGSVDVELARGIIALGQADDPMIPAFDHGAVLRDADLALAAFRAASELDPRNAEALAGQATALRMSGQLDEAVQLLDDADPALQASSVVRVETALCLAERGDNVAALRSIMLVLERDTSDLQATVVRAELLRIGPNTSLARAGFVDDLAWRFAEHAAASEAQGWMLIARSHEDALAEFHKSLSSDPSRPGAVLGAVTCLAAQGHLATARELAETALRHDPLSPQLNLCLARVLAAEQAPPPKIVQAYRHVLDLDPRMFEARRQLAKTLINLNRRAEAQEVIAALRQQYPYRPETGDASSRLSAPWRMPAPSAIGTRIHNPWEVGRDHPEHVLEHLIGEVARSWQLTPTATDRLRDRVEQDRDVVLGQAFTYEQNYLYVRDKYQLSAHPRRRDAVRRTLGHLLNGLAGVAVFAALPWLLWLFTQSVGLPDGWRWAIAIAVPLVLAGVVAFDKFFDVYFLVFGWDRIKLITFLFALSVPPTAIWQSVRWYGTSPGITVGAAAVAVIAGVYRIGSALREDSARQSVAVQDAFDRWLEYLYGAGLLPLAAEVCGALSSPYATVLPSNSKIVSEVVVDIDTEATEELRQLLRQRSKGSFALAGPRGAGKSTLVERWCAGQLLRETGVQEARMDLTVRVDAPVGYQSKDFLTHLFGRLCDEVEKYATDHDQAIDNRSAGTTRGSVRSVLLRVFRSGTRATRERRPSQGILTASDLVHRARSERNKVRFLHSHTAEGELSFGVPAMSGTALKRKTSIKRDDVPLNHPQLVDRFRAFLGLAAEVARNLDGKVLIGIDELDRISDGEGAQQFLNELKAVFNVPNCYFLVSVSEDALADFELSAMGMRTVFDSAFDTIVRVDYLTFDQAKLLLNRRVVDLPEQFSALAYVISGGLARELVRLSEAISDHKPSERLELATVAARLVRRQLGRTTRAAMDRLSRSPDRRAGATLIPVLDEHPVDELTGDLLRTFSAKIAATETDHEESDFVAGIRLDVAVMAEYLAVLLDVFDNRLDEPKMAVGAVRGPGGFETLARARRYLGANPYGARELVIAFRKAWDQETCA